MYVAGFNAQGITQKAITLDPGMTLLDARNTMMRYNLSRIVVAKDRRPAVVAKDGHPVRTITGRDLLPVSRVFGTGMFGSYWTLWKDLVEQSKKQAFIPSGVKTVFIATDVMTPNLITIGEDADLADAGCVMLRNRIRGLPVVDSNKKLNGIVARTDIIKAQASRA